MLAAFGISASAADSVGSCEIAVRHQVNRQFHTRTVDFAINSMNQNSGRHDLVSGTFFLSRDVQRDDPYQFTCSVNDINGHVRSVSLGPTAGAATGSANREMDMVQVGRNSCTGAVDQNLHDRGYNDVRINSFNQGSPSGRQDFISGSASADSGSGTDTFGFTCHMNPETGNVRSLDVFHR